MLKKTDEKLRYLIGAKLIDINTNLDEINDESMILVFDNKASLEIYDFKIFTEGSMYNVVRDGD